MSIISHSYKGLLSSKEMNQRFADFVGASVLRGFRLHVGTRSDAVSLLRAGDVDQLLVTNQGVRICEPTDLIDVVRIEDNEAGEERTDVLYLNYHHGETESNVSYTVVKGVPGEEPTILTNSSLMTPIGLIRVRPGEVALIEADLFSFQKGLTVHDLVFQEPLELPNGLVAGEATVDSLTISGEKAASEPYVDASEQAARAYADGQIAALLDNSPELLNTLNELAQALGDDPEFATTMANELAKKLDITTFTTHDTDTTRHVTSGERTGWNAKETPSGAQVKANIAETNAKTYTDTAKSDLLDGATPTLDTIGKLARSLDDDPDYHATVDAKLSAQKAVTDAHALDNGRHLTSGERTSWNAKETPTGAQAKADAAETSAKTYTDATRDGLRAGVTSTLDTLWKIAQALNNDPAYHETVDTKLAARKAETDAHALDTVKHVTSLERTDWNAKETPAGAQAKADLKAFEAEMNAKSYTDTKLADLINNAPGLLDTLDEIAQALGDDPNFATTITNLINTKSAEAESSAKAYTDVETAAILGAAPASLDTIEKLARSLNDDASFHATVDAAIAAEKAITDAHAADAERHIQSSERSAWNAKETPSGARAKADTAEANAKTYADVTKASLIDGATPTLDTLGKLAASIGNDADLRGTLTDELSTKVDDTTFDAHVADANPHVTSGERTSWNAKETPAGAQSKANTAEANAKTYTDSTRDALQGGVIASLDTLNKLAQAIDNDPDFVTTITALINSKGAESVSSASVYTDTATATLIDDVEFDAHVADGVKHVTTVERDGWDAKETPAGAQAKADTAEANAKTYADTFKVANTTFDAHTSDASKHVSTTERTAWDAKETPAGAQAKADAAEASANAYTDTHEANAIIHVTSGERTAWDAKETPAGAQTKADAAEANANVYTDSKVAELVDSSPDLLNTLGELSQALGDDPNFATTMTNELATKLPITTFDAHAADTVKHVSPAERTSWDAKETPTGAQAKADAAEASANSYTDTSVADLVAGATPTLDTLAKLAAAIDNDPSFHATIQTEIGTKADATRSLTAGTGLTGGGTLEADRSLGVDFGGNGIATTVARSDHHHDDAYLRQDTGGDVTGPVRATEEVSGTALEVKSTTTAKTARFVYNDAQDSVDLVFG